MAAIIYGGVGSGGDHIRRRWQWWQSYTVALVVSEIIFGGVGVGGDHIQRWWWRTYRWW